MKRLKFLGEPGTALAKTYAGPSGVHFDYIGHEVDVEDDKVADQILEDHPKAFEVVKGGGDTGRTKEPEHDRMRRGAGKTRGKGK